MNQFKEPTIYLARIIGGIFTFIPLLFLLDLTLPTHTLEETCLGVHPHTWEHIYGSPYGDGRTLPKIHRISETNQFLCTLRFRIPYSYSSLSGYQGVFVPGTSIKLEVSPIFGICRTYTYETVRHEVPIEAVLPPSVWTAIIITLIAGVITFGAGLSYSYSVAWKGVLICLLSTVMLYYISEIPETWGLYYQLSGYFAGFTY